MRALKVHSPQAARKLLERDPKEAVQELLKVEDLARRTTQEIRTMLFTLRPLALESDGLEAAMQAMADKMGDTYQQKVVMELEAEAVARLETNPPHLSHSPCWVM